MISRVVTFCVLVALIGATRPVAADPGSNQGCCAAGLPPRPAPVAGVPGPAVPPPRKTHQRAGTVLLIIGGTLAVTSAYFFVHAHQHRNDLNPDISIADDAIGALIGLTSLASLTVGFVFLVPNDWGAVPASHPRIGLVPRGAALRFAF